MILKRKIYISLLSFAGLILLFFLLVIYPLFSSIRKQSQDFISQKNYYAQLQERNNNLRELKRFSQEHQEELEKIDYLFVDPETPIDFNIFLEKTAQDSNLQIKIFNVQLQKPEPDKWNFLNYQLTLIGSFPNILKFLDKIENSPYLVEIFSLNIKEFEEKIGDVRADIAIKTYTK